MKNLILSTYCKTQAALSNFAKREDGATAIEYALIAGLIAVVIIVALKGVQGGITGLFGKIAETLNGVSGAE